MRQTEYHAFSHDERMRLIRHMKLQGLQVRHNSSTEAMALIWAGHLGLEAPMLLEARIALLRGLLVDLGKADKKVLTPPREHVGWKPYKVPKSMSEQLERCKGR